MKQKINISTHLSTSLKAVYESFIISQTSCGISDATITNYHNHLRGIAKHIDIDMPFDELSNCTIPRGKKKGSLLFFLYLLDDYGKIFILHAIDPQQGKKGWTM